MNQLRILIAAAIVAVSASGAISQTAQVPFGGFLHDTSLPVEISADQLVVDQSDGSATFTGNVLIGQGDMRLSAGKVRVEYSTSDSGAPGGISRLLASGGVTLVSGSDAAEAREAEYSIDSGIIVLTGDVILTQGLNALSADRMSVDLNTGVATLEGRVRTILQPGGN
jgi:lipopolysaccharide export system protein LptA